MQAKLEEIETKINVCVRCPFYRFRKQPLAGHFPETGTDVLFVFDAPSIVDDKYNMPLAGKSGNYFNKVVFGILGLKRPDYSITYCIKCLPLEKGARVVPTKSSLFWCMEYLHEQIETIKPKLVITVGFVPFYSLICRKDIEFSRKRKFSYEKYVGNLYKIKSIFKEEEFYAIPIYPPKKWNGTKTRKKSVESFLSIKRILNGIRSGEDLSDILKSSPDLPTRAEQTRKSRAEIFRKKGI